MENQKNDQLIVQLKCLKRKIKSYDEAKFLTRMRKMSVKSARNYNIDAGFWNTKVDMFIHSEIGLPPRNKLNPFYKIYPEKFNNKTNGITFRRWLLHCNNELADYITELIGNGYKKDADKLKDLAKFIDDKKVLDKLGEIKKNNKVLLKEYLKET